MVKSCLECFEEFRPQRQTQRFCSRSCSATNNNRNFPKRSPEPRVCASCGEEFLTNRRLKRCGKPECRPRNRGVVEAWLAGTYDGTTKYGLAQAIRMYLLDEAGNKCQSPTCCVPGGWSAVNPANGKSCLNVDHINGLWYDNRRENLRVLCPNCHSLTPNYGALNKGRGRKFRYSDVV